MKNKILIQRIVTLKELAEVFALPIGEIYKRNSSRRNTTLGKEGLIIVERMYHGQFDAVTHNEETGDSHLLLVLEIPQERIIEEGKGLYLEYNDFNEVLVDEFLISGYKKEEIKELYDLKGFRINDVYGDCEFGEIKDIRLENILSRFTKS
jgi:hypothetical protein